jgi:hypothetical protein
VRWSGKWKLWLVAACVASAVGAGAAVHFADNRQETAAPTEASPLSGGPVSKGEASGVAAAGAPAGSAEDAVAPSDAKVDESARLVGAARRLAADGEFAEARAALDKADKLIPGQPETARARRDIEEMGTPEAQFALQIDRARSAIARSDRAAATTALGEAERLKPQAPEIAQLHQALADAEQKAAQRSARITGLLTDMREAIARHDMAAADRALDEAGRLDVHDPALDQARTELARAQENERRREAERSTSPTPPAVPSRSLR